eukprot:754493-Hanusia_phi.AAC.1
MAQLSTLYEAHNLSHVHRQAVTHRGPATATLPSWRDVTPDRSQSGCGPYKERTPARWVIQGSGRGHPGG